MAVIVPWFVAKLELFFFVRLCNNKQMLSRYFVTEKLINFYNKDTNK